MQRYRSKIIEYYTGNQHYEDMAKITDKNAYDAAMARIEELLPLVDDDTPKTDKNLIELDLLSELVSEYEDEHYPIPSPSLIDVLKRRMYEMGLHSSQNESRIRY